MQAKLNSDGSDTSLCFCYFSLPAVYVRSSVRSPLMPAVHVRGFAYNGCVLSTAAVHLKDNYTLLPDTEDRCLATELSADWSYNSK